MQKIRCKNSLKFRSMAALSGLLVLFSSLIIAYNFYIFKIMDREIDTTLKTSLECTRRRLNGIWTMRKRF